MPSTKSVIALSQESSTSYPLKACQIIYKAVFGEKPNRDDAVKVLKKKFAVKPDQLTSLTMTQLLEVLAKKLVNSKYCSIKEDTNMANIRMDNVTVHKEIAL